MHGLETLAMQYISASNINKETGINSDVVSENKELAEELHKSVIKKKWKRESTLTFYRQYLGCWFS